MSANADDPASRASRTTGPVENTQQPVAATTGGAKTTERPSSSSSSSSSNNADRTPNQRARSSERKTNEKVDVEKEPVTSERPSIPPLAGVADDDGKYETGRWEIWAYYAYYIGNNGLSLFNFAPAQSQNLLTQAADPDTGLLPFLGAYRTTNSIVLLANGISFAIQCVIFLILGSYADFGTWRPVILFVTSLLAYGIGFGWLGVADPEKWRIGVAMYMIGLIAYQTALTFWTAAFPSLARNTREIRAKANDLSRGSITQEAYDYQDSLMRSRLSNMAFYAQSCGEILILAVIVGVMFGLHVNAGTEQNTWGLSVLIAFASGVWLLLSVPWFVLEKRRPGMSTGNMNIALAGLWQLRRAVTKIVQLRQTLYYLVGYFLLGDCLNTSVTVIQTLQNSVAEYSTLSLTYLLLVGIASQAVGIYSFWYIQRRFRLSTKTMFNVIAVAIAILDGWGLVGVFTQRFGFHHRWELWLFQIYYVTPRTHTYLFFSLFSITGKTSAFIGPVISSAIIDATPSGNESAPFYFLFGLAVVSVIFLVCSVDLRKSRVEQERFVREEAGVRREMGGL
ncbi:MAG: hypothetical protein M1831_005697 [Alyxoria varia]|nr:MAG: hypothetical protein M1831_005697 [Alyxoria varia]